MQHWEIDGGRARREQPVDSGHQVVVLEPSRGEEGPAGGQVVVRWEPRRSEWSSAVQRPVGVVESVKTQIPVARYEVSFGTWVWLDRRGRQRAARSDSTTVESHPPKRGPETQTRTEVAQGEPQVGLMVGSRTAAGGGGWPVRAWPVRCAVQTLLHNRGTSIASFADAVPLHTVEGYRRTSSPGSPVNCFSVKFGALARSVGNAVALEKSAWCQSLRAGRHRRVVGRPCE